MTTKKGSIIFSINITGLLFYFIFTSCIYVRPEPEIETIKWKHLGDNEYQFKTNDKEMCDKGFSAEVILEQEYDDNEDLIVEIDFKQISGSSSNNYGIIFYQYSGDKRDKGLLFIVNNTGTCQWASLDKNNSKFNVQNFSSDKIKKSKNEANRITIKKMGTFFILGINGVLIADKNASYTKSEFTVNRIHIVSLLGTEDQQEFPDVPYEIRAKLIRFP